MLDRLTELALFLAPFVVFALLWLGAARGWGIVLGGVVFLLAVVAALWIVADRRLPVGDAYRPAALRAGHVRLPREAP